MPNTQGMLQYHTVYCASTSGLSLTNALASLGEKKRHIERIWFSPLWSSAPTNSLEAVAKIQQTEILSFDLTHFMDTDTDTDQYLSVKRDLEMDVTLERGEAFNVGFRLSGTNVGGSVTIAYRDLE